MKIVTIVDNKQELTAEQMEHALNKMQKDTKLIILGDNIEILSLSSVKSSVGQLK